MSEKTSHSVWTVSFTLQELQRGGKPETNTDISMQILRDNSRF